MRHKFYYLFLTCCIGIIQIKAQDFITRGKIEFEKRTNMYKNVPPAALQQMKEYYPEFKEVIYDYVFANGRSIYKPRRENVPIGNPFSTDRNSLYTDQNSRKTIARKNLVNEDYIIEDSILPIKWRIDQETRMIAGYECRKAIGRISDTLYLVAFYSEQLLIKGGPEGINGLPGMILGLAIPRFNTTWFATKVEFANVDETEITPPTVKGKKLSRSEIIEKATKKFKQIGGSATSSLFIEHMLTSYY